MHAPSAIRRSSLSPSRSHALPLSRARALPRASVARHALRREHGASSSTTPDGGTPTGRRRTAARRTTRARRTPTPSARRPRRRSISSSSSTTPLRWVTRQSSSRASLGTLTEEAWSRPVTFTSASSRRRSARSAATSARAGARTRSRHLSTVGPGSTPLASAAKGFLSYGAGAPASVDTLIADAETLVNGVGESGCGLEAQLESAYRFLVQPDPWQSVTLDATQRRAASRRRRRPARAAQGVPPPRLARRRRDAHRRGRLERRPAQRRRPGLGVHGQPVPRLDRVPRGRQDDDGAARHERMRHRSRLARLHLLRLRGDLQRRPTRPARRSRTTPSARRTAATTDRPRSSSTCASIA